MRDLQTFATGLGAALFLGGCGPWHYRQATIALDRGSVQGATYHFEQCIQYSPKNVAAYSQLGVIHLKASRYADAAELFRRALEIDPTDHKTRLDFGLAIEFGGDARAAERAYQAVLDVDRTNAEAHHRMARLRLADGRIQEALEAAELSVRFCAQDLHQSRYRFLKARIHALCEQYDKALEEIAILEKGGREIQGLDGLKGAVLYQSGGALDQAEVCLESAARKEPAAPAHRINLACVFMRESRWKDALSQLEEALRIAPGHAGVYANLGRCHEELDDLDAARSAYEKALQMDPGDVVATEGLERLKRKRTTQ